MMSSTQMTLAQLEKVCQRHAFNKRTKQPFTASSRPGFTEPALRVCQQVTLYFTDNAGTLDLTPSKIEAKFASLVSRTKLQKGAPEFLSVQSAMTIFSSFRTLLSLVTKEDVSTDTKAIEEAYIEHKRTLNAMRMESDENGEYTEEELAMYMPFADISMALEQATPNILKTPLPMTSQSLSVARSLLLCRLLVIDYPTRRNEYLSLTIGKREATDNYVFCSEPNVTPKVWTIHLGNYKTSTMYGEVEFQLTSESGRLVEIILTETDNDHLFEESVAAYPSRYSRRVQSAFAHFLGRKHAFSVRLLRRLIIEHYHKNGLLNSMVERKKLSQKMGHSVQLQLSVYTRHQKEQETEGEGEEVAEINPTTSPTPLLVSIPIPVKKMLDGLAVLHFDADHPALEAQQWTHVLESPAVIHGQIASRIFDHYLQGSTEERCAQLQQIASTLPSWQQQQQQQQ